MTINIKKFQKNLKIKIKNKSYLTQALTHKSADESDNNEKLEFLGDRVIGLILSEKLFKIYPEESEGVLDRRFAKLVNKKTCADVGWSLGLADYIKLGDSKKKINRKDEKILSDTCEAVIGAVYLDQGYEYSKNFVLRVWSKEIEKSNITILDSKTLLQEHSLKNFKKLPVYQLLSVKGPRHKPIFKISVSINKSKDFIGTGNSKQDAEKNAASNLLKSNLIK
tara:strand:+ start:16187 stop:16855 length:669 start_codon:yes stop_codon:yes gene_type:complete